MLSAHGQGFGSAGQPSVHTHKTMQVLCVHVCIHVCVCVHVHVYNMYMYNVCGCEWMCEYMCVYLCAWMMALPCVLV